MDFTQITDPLDGERTVEVVPPAAPLVDAPWVRARFVTGQSVSATELDREQEHHAGRLRLIGRALRRGIVSGLQTAIELDGAGHPRRVSVQPGQGISALGEDVIVPRTLVASALALDIATTTSLPVIGASEALAPTLADALSFWEDNGPRASADESSEEAEDSTRLDFVAAPPPFPAVLVLEPVVVEEIGQQELLTHSNPCERDPQAEPFEDWRHTDAARLRWVPLVALLDERGLDVDEWLIDAAGPLRTLDSYRSGLAWGIFELEAQAPLPWDREGVPIALAAFDTSGDVLFLDRAAVARRAGRALIPGPLPFDPSLAQARIEQFVEQLSSIQLESGLVLASRLRKLPPAGVLPRSLIDLSARRTQLFPSSWGISAAPVPLETLDPIIQSAAPLSPLDLESESGDEIRLLVPVAASVWEPGLLQIAGPSPDFYAAIADARFRVHDAAERRSELRAKLDTLYGAVGGAHAIPERPLEDDEAATIERVVRSVLWNNDDAIALIANMASIAAEQPLLPNRTALKEALQALLGAAGTDAESARDQNVLVDAFDGVRTHGPVLVVPYAKAPHNEAEEAVIGAGFELEGGWALPEMVTDADGVALRWEGELFLCAGSLDTEGLDRARATARKPLVILTADIDPHATEDLAWMLRRDREGTPLVAVLSNGSPDDRVQRIQDIAQRLGGVESHAHPPEFQVRRFSVAAAAKRDSVIIVARRRKTMPVFEKLERLKDELGLEGPAGPRKTEIERRLSILEDRAAMLRVADDLAPDGLPRPARMTLATRILYALENAPRTSALSANDLLALVLAKEGSFGITPITGGLSVDLLVDLIDHLKALVTPPDNVRILRDADIDVIGEAGVAGLIAVLMEQLDRATDVVDFGFLQVQAATYRAREHLLGKDAAQRMASSPLLPELATMIQPKTDAAQLHEFFDKVKESSALPAANGKPGWLNQAIKYTTPKSEIFRFVGGFDPKDPLLDLTQPLSEIGDAVQPHATQPPAQPPAKARPTTVPARPPALGAGKLGHETAPVLELHGMKEMVNVGKVLRGPVSKAVTTSSIKILGALSTQPSISVTISKMTMIAKEIRARDPVSWTLRQSGVSERITDSVAVELRAEAFRLRGMITKTIFGLELNLDGVKFPGFITTGADSLSHSVSLPLTQTLVDEVLKGLHDLATANADPSALVSDAVRSMETTAAMLRIVESRIRETRDAIDICKRAQVLLEQLIDAAEQRHEVVQGALDEAAHDLSVASSLLAEENERVAQINARRERVLANEVPFFVFHRSREVDAHDDLPIHDVEPTLTTSPALEALRSPAPHAPDELRRAVDLFREAPARWLRFVHPHLIRVDRFERVQAVLLGSRMRAQAMLVSPPPAARALDGLRGVQLVSAMLDVRSAALAVHRQPAASLALAQVPLLSWAQAQGRLREVASLADLLSDVPAAISREVAAELDSIHRVAAHLYARAGEVTPRIRLAWAERISAYDRPIDLRDLSVLPSWADVGTDRDGEPDPFRKRELAALVQWIFDRVEPGEPEAHALANDLVRVAILLSAHAPVARILAGHVDTPAPLEPGRTIAVRIDPNTVRVGMHALIMQRGQIAARAIVEDLSQQHVMTRVISAGQSGSMLAAGETVRFVEPDSLPMASSAGQIAAQPNRGALLLLR